MQQKPSEIVTIYRRKLTVLYTLCLPVAALLIVVAFTTTTARLSMTGLAVLGRPQD